MKTTEFAPVAKALAIVALMAAAVYAGAAAGQNLTDPYEILGEYLDASGGLGRLKAERRQHLEGTISLGGMEGSIEMWSQKPDISRVELLIGPLEIKQGDNGEVKWEIGANGKLQVTTKLDEATLKRDEVERRMAEYEYADPGSDVFSLTLEGIQAVDSADCYMLRISNNINADHHTYFISVDDFRLLKSVDIQGENSSETHYADYREVDGLMVAFYNRQLHYQTGQMHEIFVAGYESNPEIDLAIFDPPEAGGRDYEFTDGDSARNIAFRFIENHLFIPVTIAGEEGLWVLDTGASMSVVDRAFADKLGLETEGNLKAAGAGGSVDIGLATLPPFELEGVRFDEQKVAVIDMTELIRRLGVEIPGILGFDFLSRFVTRIDFANELVSFYDPESFSYSGSGKVLDLHLKDNVFETHATLDGKISGTWLFDIGASSTSLDGPYAVRGDYMSKKGVLIMAHGASHEFQVKKVHGEHIDFAGFTLDDPTLSFRPAHTDTTVTADRVGIMGNTVFRNFIVYVDYENERVILEKGDMFNRPWPEDHSGLNVGWTPDHSGIEVIYVSPDTPAERAGFEKGDIVKSVDGAAVEPESDVLALRERLRDAPGTMLEVVVERGGEMKTLKLTLADLY